MIDYTPPSIADLKRLKEELGYTGEQMAALASLSGGQQWRKYTGGAAPRSVGFHMLFFIAARLSLPPEALQQVGEKMLSLGACLDPSRLHKDG
ncbi:MAG: XRE family transcriptional regulator [Betaproteobacteria bacterium]|nr:XRE family transcriptional regulator [Betaproteobacteria bacterium]